MESTVGEGRLIAGMAAEGWLRWAAVDIAAMLESVRRRMDLSPTSASVLGRSLAGAALLQQFSSGGAERIMIEIAGQGPIRSVVAEADERGRLRGLVADRHAETLVGQNGELSVGATVVGGSLRVVRVRAGKVHASQVELTSGDVGEGLAHYLLQSEQTRSAVLVGVLVGPNGVTAAGGVMIEAFPGVSEEVLTGLESRLESCGSISRRLAADGLQATVTALLSADREDNLEATLTYECRCSRARIHRYLEHLGRDEWEVNEDVIEVDCGFCGTRYAFTLSELSGPAKGG